MKAVQRKIENVWTLDYNIVDDKTIEIVHFSSDDGEGYERERELPKHRLIEDNERTIIAAEINGKRYEVKNPKHVFDYEMKSQLEKNLEALPKICAALNPANNTPIIIKRGESGYYHSNLVKTEHEVELFNLELGITPEEVEAMLAGSCFGWDCEGAHPDIWKGKIKKAIKDGK